MNSPRVLTLGVLVVASVVSSCRPTMPPPRYPLVSTPDEPFRASPPPPLAVTLPVIAPPVSVTLPNGLRVVVARRAGARVLSLRWVARAAGSADARVPAGLAALVASVVERGLDGSGITVSSTTSWEASTFSMAALPEQSTPLLAAAARVFDRSVLTRDAFEQTLSALVQARSRHRDRMSFAQEVAMGRLLGVTWAYGRPVGGRLESLRTVTFADAIRFWEERYVPAASALVIAGDIDPAEMIREVTARFGAIEGPPAPEHPPHEGQPPRPEARVAIIGAEYRNQADIVIALRAPRDRSEDTQAIQVLSQVLGGAFSSRLNLRVREGLNVSYGVHATVLLGAETGALLVGATVERSAVGPSLTAMLEEINRLRHEPIAESELARFRLGWHESMAARVESTVEESASIANDLVRDRDIAAEAARVDALTPEAIRAVAERYLTIGDAEFAIAGDTADIERQIAPLHLGPTLHVRP